MTRVFHRKVSGIESGLVGQPVSCGVGADPPLSSDQVNGILLKGVVLPLAVALALAGILYWSSGLVA